MRNRIFGSTTCFILGYRLINIFRVSLIVLAGLHHVKIRLKSHYKATNSLDLLSNLHHLNTKDKTLFLREMTWCNKMQSNQNVPGEMWEMNWIFSVQSFRQTKGFCIYATKYVCYYKKRDIILHAYVFADCI